MLRFTKAISYSLPETEDFHRGSRPYGASSRSGSSRDSAEPRRGAAAPPGHPLDVRPTHFTYVTEFVEGQLTLTGLKSLGSCLHLFQTQ